MQSVLGTKIIRAYSFFYIAQIAEIQDEHLDWQICHCEEECQKFAVLSDSKHPELINANCHEEERMQECIVKIVIDEHLENQV